MLTCLPGEDVPGLRLQLLIHAQASACLLPAGQDLSGKPVAVFGLGDAVSCE